MRTTTRLLAATAATIAVMFAATSVASAQTYPGPPAPPENVVVVQPDTEVFAATAAQNPAPTGAPGAQVQGSNLAFTGGEALTMAIVGMLLLAGGMAIMTTRRRQLAQI
jgi:hypothetical protein